MTTNVAIYSFETRPGRVRRRHLDRTLATGAGELPGQRVGDGGDALRLGGTGYG